jgi:hypothetical protein
MNGGYFSRTKLQDTRLLRHIRFNRYGLIPRSLLRRRDFESSQVRHSRMLVAGPPHGFGRIRPSAEIQAKL